MALSGSFVLALLFFFALSINPLEARGPFDRLARKPPQRTAAEGICASSVRIFGYKCEEHDVRYTFLYFVVSDD